jgi:hypothetical protein
VTQALAEIRRLRSVDMAMRGITAALNHRAYRTRRGTAWRRESVARVPKQNQLPRAANAKRGFGDATGPKLSRNQPERERGEGPSGACLFSLLVVWLCQRGIFPAKKIAIWR